ncbi:MAG: RluA family pseudouridine synthase [Candidatus Cloacimonas sp.]|nr:RluA family pseudouridine synthase [Candidatus Cloacimonadota bacterium]
MILTYELEESIRIDRYLSSLDLELLFSRSFIEKLLKEEKILVNSKPVKKSYLLEAGDVIEIKANKIKNSRTALPDNTLPLDIIFEDDYIAILNKQAGVPVHPSPGKYSGTIVNALLSRYGNELPSLEDEQRPGIVHRLDKNTSGLMLIAKDERTLSKLSRLFAKREVQKGYKAIVVGIPDPPSGTIETMLGRNLKERTKMSVVSQGRQAITEYRVAETIEAFSLLEVNLITGRTHQIRVHLDHIGHPIFGDEVYGRNKLLSRVPQVYRKRVENYLDKQMIRQALHSYSLSFIHPITKEELSFEIGLPEDMQNAWDWLKKLFAVD